MKSIQVNTKVNNKSPKYVKGPRSGLFIINFEQIPHFVFLCFYCWTWIGKRRLSRTDRNASWLQSCTQYLCWKLTSSEPAPVSLIHFIVTFIHISQLLYCSCLVDLELVFLLLGSCLPFVKVCEKYIEKQRSSSKKCCSEDSKKVA